VLARIKFLIEQKQRKRNRGKGKGKGKEIGIQK